MEPVQVEHGQSGLDARVGHRYDVERDGGDGQPGHSAQRLA